MTAAVGVAIAIVMYFAVRVVLDDMAARAVAIFVLAAVFWTAEVLPLFATALLVVVLEIIFLASEGGFADHITRLLGLSPAIRAGSPNAAPISAHAFIEPFASDIIMLWFSPGGDCGAAWCGCRARGPSPATVYHVSPVAHLWAGGALGLLQHVDEQYQCVSSRYIVH